jgi:class 3 adenylate cyclase
VRTELDHLEPVAGFCSGACGSDLLFAELMVERGAELTLVLPFAREDFYATSVDFGLAGMAEYRRRFDALLARDDVHVHFGTDEAFLGDDLLFELANSFARGLALLRAAELGVEATALVVLDRASPAKPGGTARFLEAWTDGGRPARVVDLAALRSRVDPQPPAWWREAAAALPTPERRARREVKVMLFADVKNYSQLREEQAPAFFVTFLGEVAEVIQGTDNCPAFCNTWGDGLFLVFNGPVDAADFALRLLDRIGGTDWARVGLPADTTVRIGLHAGPVYPHWDRLIGRQNFFGTQVNRAARIEPVTMPGCVYTSELFAALLAVTPGHRFACAYLGAETLGKAHDQFRCVLYRLTRKAAG